MGNLKLTIKQFDNINFYTSFINFPSFMILTVRVMNMGVSLGYTKK